MNVFKRNPGGRQIAQRISGHVDGIGMHALLGALVRQDGLQRLRLALHQQANPVQQFGMFQNAAEAAGFLVRVEKAPGIRILVAGRLRFQSNAAVANRLLISAPDGIERGVVNQFLQDDVAVRDQQRHCSASSSVNSPRYQFFLDALQGILPIQPGIRARHTGNVRREMPAPGRISPLDPRRNGLACKSIVSQCRCDIFAYKLEARGQ